MADTELEPQQDRIREIVAEERPSHTVEFEFKLGMMRFRIDDPTGTPVAVSGYDLPSVIAGWTDDVLRQAIRMYLASGMPPK